MGWYERYEWRRKRNGLEGRAVVKVTMNRKIRYRRRREEIQGGESRVT